MSDREREKKRILFVDDEQTVLDGLRRMLRGRRGEWDLRFANGVDAALEILSGEAIDTVVTDVNMPVRDGFDLLATIRANPAWEGLPVVILTGNGEAGLKRKALDLGATDLLSKPVSNEDLVARVHSVLRIKAHEDRLEQRVRERTAQLEVAQAELIWRLGKAGEFRDSETGYHVVRVGFFARQLALAMGLDAEFTRSVFLTAPLHDIGKIGVPDGILLKPGKLTGDEWVTMRAHTTIGGKILRDDIIAKNHIEALGLFSESVGVLHNPLSEMAARIAENHHERWDGRGYPLGCKGEEIPMEARLTTVADVYDALRSRRPYKESYPPERVLAILSQGRETQFDPDVLDAFERSIDAFEEIRTEFDDQRLEEPHADLASALEELGDAA